MVKHLLQLAITGLAVLATSLPALSQDRFIVLASLRRTQGPDPAEREKLDDLLMG